MTAAVQRGHFGPPERFFFGDGPEVAAVRARLWNLALTYLAFRTLFRPAAARDMKPNAFMALAREPRAAPGAGPEIAGRRSDATVCRQSRGAWRC